MTIICPICPNNAPCTTVNDTIIETLRSGSIKPKRQIIKIVQCLTCATKYSMRFTQTTILHKIGDKTN